MSEKEDFSNEEAIHKLKRLVEEINICLFCTNLETDDGATCRPMGAQDVDPEGNIWFFSEKTSDKNKDIAHNKNVQLFFSHPGKGSYLVVNGEAEISVDKNKIEELWNPIVKMWFPEGKDDPNISIIKVKPTTAYYWDTNGSKMINLIKMVASVATGTNLIEGKEGTLTVTV